MRETGSIRCAVIGDEKPEQVILTYRHRSGPGTEWEEMREPVPIEWTACNFGGEAVVCLSRRGMRRRVAILYEPGCYFLCRHCYDLVYESQRDNAMDRALHKAQSIRKRLGGSANMLEPFPGKLKGMDWRTNERLWWEHHEGEMEQLIGMREWPDRLKKKVGKPRLRRLFGSFWG